MLRWSPYHFIKKMQSELKLTDKEVPSYFIHCMLMGKFTPAKDDDNNPWCVNPKYFKMSKVDRMPTDMVEISNDSFIKLLAKTKKQVAPGQIKLL